MCSFRRGGSSFTLLGAISSPSLPHRCCFEMLAWGLDAAIFLRFVSCLPPTKTAAESCSDQKNSLR